MTSCKKYYSTTDTQVLQALTDTFSIDSSQWVKVDDHFQYTDSNIANLRSNDTNSSIIDSGAVLIYLSSDTGKTYELLPSDYNNGHNFKASAGDGEVTVFAYPSPDTSYPTFLATIKIISIPSNIAYKTINYNPQDYQDVERAFHLKE